MSEKTGYCESADGLKLFYRIYQPAVPQQTVLCLPGLSRNSRDFQSLARRLQDRYRVITPDLRGRGFSDWDPNPENYQPPTYVQDTWRLLDHLDVDRVVVIGTSLGGLMAMMMAAEQPERLAGVVLNDIGPEIAPQGIARIQQYVGRQPPAGSWEEAAEQAKTIYGTVFPGYGDEDWLRLARQSYREDDNGALRIDMDPAIGEAARKAGDGPPLDLWPLFEAMPMPVLVIHGARSDILVESILDEMKRRRPGTQVVTISNRGHAPDLDEPQAATAIDRFLASLD